MPIADCEVFLVSLDPCLLGRLGTTNEHTVNKQTVTCESSAQSTYHEQWLVAVYLLRQLVN